MRVTAALDALARNHSISRPARRQCLVAHFAPLQQVGTCALHVLLDFLSLTLFCARCFVQAFMGKLASVVYRLLLTVATAELEGGGGRAAGALSSSSLCNLARLVVALSCAALQCLGRYQLGYGDQVLRNHLLNHSAGHYTGKKSFGRSATDVLNVSVDFAENVGAHPQLGALLFERAGLALSRQLLELAQVLAEATAATSATANEQAATTHRLLCCVAARLSDDRICAELLQPVNLFLPNTCTA
jgi:ATP/maltotriose-dependent transcriptional regulator MalT